MNAVIFLGPTLPVAEARTILTATYLPPAGQGDLLSAVTTHRPDVIGLIDGLFQQSLSVWHKEILYALDQGIAVYGASSMGALRAAETAAFGMVGVGEIFQSFASGDLLDDDEVALVHGPPDTDFRRLSEPMVNLRATFVAAHRAGVVDSATTDLLIATAKALHFSDRRFPTIFAQVREQIGGDPIAGLEEFTRSHYADLKADDARLLLRAVAEHRAATRPPGSGFTFSRTSHFDALYNRDRQVRHGGVEIPLEAIGNYVALHHPDFEDVNFNALNRVLVLNWAALLGIEVDDNEVATEEQRFRTRHDVGTDEQLTAWFQHNNLSPEEFRQLLRETATCRRLHRWLLIARWMDRSTKPILDQLRLNGEYSDWARRAAAQERLLDGFDTIGSTAGEGGYTLQELLEDHQQWTDFRLNTDLSAWGEEAGFHSDANLKMELLRARLARTASLRLLAQVTEGT